MLFLLSKWNLLFSSLILLKIIKAVVKCIFSIVINVCNGSEFVLKSDENSVFSHKTFSEIERNSTKNRGLRRPQASDTVAPNTNPAYADCLISNLPIGKKVRVRHLNRHEIEIKFTDGISNNPNNSQNRTATVKKTSDPITLQIDKNVFAKIRWSSDPLDYTRTRQSSKVTQESTLGLKKIIKQSKCNVATGNSCFEYNASDGIAELSNSKNKFSESVSLNIPQQIVTNSLDFVDLRHKNVCHEKTTIEGGEKQHFQDFACKNDVNAAKQNAFPCGSKDSDNQLYAYCPGNPTIDAVVCDKEEVLHYKDTHNVTKTIPNNRKRHFKDCETNLDLRKGKLSAIQYDSKKMNGQLDGDCALNSITDAVLDNKVRLFSEISDILDQQQHKTNEEAKLTSSQSDDNIKTCLNTKDNEVAKGTSQKNFASFGALADGADNSLFLKKDDNKTISKSVKDDNNKSGSIQLFGPIWTFVLSYPTQNCTYFLKELSPTLDEIEEGIVRNYQFYNRHTFKQDFKEIQFHVQELLRMSSAMNSEFYHERVKSYLNEIFKLFAETLASRPRYMDKSNQLFIRLFRLNRCLSNKRLTILLSKEVLHEIVKVLDYNGKISLKQLKKNKPELRKVLRNLFSMKYC